MKYICINAKICKENCYAGRGVEHEHVKSCDVEMICELSNKKIICVPVTVPYTIILPEGLFEL